MIQWSSTSLWNLIWSEKCLFNRLKPEFHPAPRNGIGSWQRSKTKNLTIHMIEIPSSKCAWDQSLMSMVVKWICCYIRWLKADWIEFHWNTGHCFYQHFSESLFAFWDYFFPQRIHCCFRIWPKKKKECKDMFNLKKWIMKWMLYAKDVKFDDYYSRAADLPYG